MPYRSIEATKRKSLKRIERLQERQKRLIDRIVYESDSLSENKIKGIKSSIRKVEKMIRRKRDEIANGYRAPHKCLKRKRKRQQEAEGDGIRTARLRGLTAPHRPRRNPRVLQSGKGQRRAPVRNALR